MQLRFIQQGAPRLILIFAGWAMDWRPFATLSRPGYDIAVVWDYTDLTTGLPPLDSYSEICVVAWSLGVRAAESGVLDKVYGKVTLRLAVNGTSTPVDDEAGIPRSLFEATRQGLSPDSLDRFYRRVAGGASAFRTFMAHRPERELAGLARELDIFLEDSLPRTALPFRWDRAVVSDRDAIFPPDNQKRAWAGVPVDSMAGAHLPDMQALLDAYIIDKDRTAVRFQSEIEVYEEAALAQKKIVAELMEMMRSHRILSGKGALLEVGSGSGLLSRALARELAGATLEMWDLTEGPSLPSCGIFRRGDAEMMIRSVEEGSLDAVVSSSTIQWFNSPARFLENCGRVLRPGGYLVFSSFGQDNLTEVAAATGRALPRMSLEQWRQAVPDCFEPLLVRERRIRLGFGSAVGLFRHLRDTGVNSLSADGTGALRKALASMRPDASGQYCLTYHPVFLILKKR